METVTESIELNTHFLQITEALVLVVLNSLATFPDTSSIDLIMNE